MEENHSCLFQQELPFAWSKFPYFPPCQNNLQAPPMPEHLHLVKQVSFIHVQHLKSSKENNCSAQALLKWNAIVKMHCKFRWKLHQQHIPTMERHGKCWTPPYLEMPSVLLQLFCYAQYGNEGLSLHDYCMETELMHSLEKLELENFSRQRASMSPK